MAVATGRRLTGKERQMHILLEWYDPDNPGRRSMAHMLVTYLKLGAAFAAICAAITFYGTVAL